MSEEDEEGGGRNTDTDTRLFWGSKAEGISFFLTSVVFELKPRVGIFTFVDNMNI